MDELKQLNTNAQSEFINVRTEKLKDLWNDNSYGMLAESNQQRDFYGHSYCSAKLFSQEMFGRLLTVVSQYVHGLETAQQLLVVQDSLFEPHKMCVHLWINHNTCSCQWAYCMEQ